jgi:dienelactone hydrolase
MNPGFQESDAAVGADKLRSLKIVTRAAWRASRLFVRALLVNPIRVRRGEFRVDDGSTPAMRFLRGLLYRLAFVPIIVVLCVSALVYVATHPTQVACEADPTSIGLYFDPVKCVTEDGVRLDAWVIPVVDASRVLNEREDVLRNKYPAVILVHDYAANAQQMLPLVKPLHEAGFVVMVLGTRGSGMSSSSAVTFGLREAMDVKAGVELLRRRTFIDPSRISVVGLGAGANAALLAAEQNAPIASMVLGHPINGADELVATRLAPRQSFLAWSRPLCKWVFEVAYQLDADELDLRRHDRTMQRSPTLIIDSEFDAFHTRAGAQRIIEFLTSAKPASSIAQTPR